MRVALYLRRSTNEILQADSLAVQEEILRTFAATRSYDVVRVFRDSASGRSLKKRSDFKTLIEVVRGGPPFEALLVRDVSRWGRFENVDESAYWEFFFFSNGCRVLYVEEPFRDDDSPYAVLMKSLKRVLASEFSREKSQAVRYTQARVVKQGFSAIGSTAYGMIRVMVKPQTGEVVREMQPGEWKGIGNWRTKMAPGDPAKQDVVREVFRLYVEDNLSTAEVADRLNRQGIPGPKSAKWVGSTVKYLLKNPVYIGIAKYSVRRKERPLGSAIPPLVKEAAILTPESFEAVVSQDIWQRANDRIAASVLNTRERILTERMHAGIESFGPLDAEDSEAWLMYVNRFWKGPASLEEAYREEIGRGREAVRSLLLQHFTVEEHEEGWLVGGFLYVGLKVSFPYLRAGVLCWGFHFDGSEGFDVTLGLGFTPPPVRHLETCLIQNVRFPIPARPVARYPALNNASRHAPAKTEAELIASLRSCVYWRNPQAAEHFVATLAVLPLAKLSEVAEKLGWPYNVVHHMYRKLAAEGVWLPPLKIRPGRRITVVCPHCGIARDEQPWKALKRHTHLCGSCTISLQTKEKEHVVCPRCQTSRFLAPSAFRKLSHGKDTMCITCSRKDASERDAEVWARHRILSLERRTIALTVVGHVAKQLAQAGDCIEIGIQRRGSEVRWKQREGRNRSRLVIRVHDSLVLLAPLSDRGVRNLIARAADRARWQKWNQEKGTVFSWIVILTAEDVEPYKGVQPRNSEEARLTQHQSGSLKGDANFSKARRRWSSRFGFL
jgi:DNA invertase Pin-like site-specific DNA recombinase